MTTLFRWLRENEDFKQQYARAKEIQLERMADEFHLLDCFECGACSYVCPAHIPLVQRFRAAKGLVRKRRATS